MATQLIIPQNLTEAREQWTLLLKEFVELEMEGVKYLYFLFKMLIKTMEDETIGSDQRRLIALLKAKMKKLSGLSTWDPAIFTTLGTSALADAFFTLCMETAQAIESDFVSMAFNLNGKCSSNERS